MLIRAFINFHNQITLKTISKPFSPDKILILLPHCLQKETCTTKITLNINECKECGDCIISQVKVLNNMGLTVKIAPGGTIARQMVKKYNPGLVVAVACENDLNRGIRNVLHCPVLGIINERPNGPCHQTTFSLTECLQFIRQVAASPDGA